MIRIEKQDTPHSLSLPSPKIRCPVAMPTPSVALPSLAIVQLLSCVCLACLACSLTLYHVLHHADMLPFSHVIYSILYSYIILPYQLIQIACYLVLCRYHTRILCNYILLVYQHIISYWLTSLYIQLAILHHAYYTIPTYQTIGCYILLIYQHQRHEYISCYAIIPYLYTIVISYWLIYIACYVVACCVYRLYRQLAMQ